MRDTAIQIIRAVGVDTGGCNIQFAVDPTTGRMVVIEMNPRVSRSSALASKATGFPIAKIATRLAIGYTLDEIPNDITGQTPASFEPALDYVVVKIPRFAFEKFPGADPTLTTHMKSVGEAMAIGRSFAEALQKAQRSLESPTGPFRLHPTRSTAARGAARPLPRPARRPAGHHAPGAARRAPPPSRWRRPPGSTRGSSTSWTNIKELSRTIAAAPELDAAAAPAGEGRRVLRRRHRRACASCRPTQVRALRHSLGAPPRLPRGRHLRGRVRGAHAVPVLDLRRGRRGAGRRHPQGDHPRQRAEPHRPGHRVRLLLRARLVRAARGGLRDRHGQLQPGDGLHRLRHLLPAVLRAAHPGGRARGGARRAARPGRWPA